MYYLVRERGRERQRGEWREKCSLNCACLFAVVIEDNFTF